MINPPSRMGKKNDDCSACRPAPTASGPHVAARCGTSNPSPGTVLQPGGRALLSNCRRVPPDLTVFREVILGPECVVPVLTLIRAPTTGCVLVGLLTRIMAIGAAVIT